MHYDVILYIEEMPYFCVRPFCARGGGQFRRLFEARIKKRGKI